MPRLNKLLTGHDITDEVINRTSSTSLKLDHDTMLASSVVVRTAAGGGGTLLTLTTDYTLGNEDTDLSTEVGGGAHVYTTLAVVNGAYHSTNLYVTYKTVGDYASAESAVDIIDDADSIGGVSVPAIWYSASGTGGSDGNGGRMPAPKPRVATTSDIGHMLLIAAANSYSLPSGGTWQYFIVSFDSSAGTRGPGSVAGVASGGTSIFSTSGATAIGFAVRIS